MLTGVPKSQQVEIARATRHFGNPDREQHCALEDKAARVGRAAQPIEQALVDEPGQKDVERLAGLPREVE